MVAAKMGNVGIVRKLIHHGASVILTDKVNKVLFESVCTRVSLAWPHPVPQEREGVTSFTAVCCDTLYSA